MLHSNDPSQDYEDGFYKENLDDKADFGFVNVKFYKIDDLEKDGFIHEDGSLCFTFTIKKQNKQERLQ